MSSWLNKPAPQFKLSDQTGTVRSLSDYTGKTVVLYFYPKDMTSGCTVEAQQFQALHAQFIKAGAQVLGVSTDSVDSHKTFAHHCQVQFPLLADAEQKVVQQYGVWMEKTVDGKKVMGIQRSTFLIKNGTVVKHYANVTPHTHASEVLKDIQTLQ